MKQLFKIEFSRAICNKKLIVVLIIEAALIIFDFFSYGMSIRNKTIPFLLEHASNGKVDNIPGTLSVWIGLHYGQMRTIIYSVLPILAAFPYGESLYQDEKYHYNYNIITRTKKSNYYMAKLVAQFISGGLCAVFPFLLSLILNAMILPFENVMACLSNFMGDAYFLSELFYSAPIAYVLLYLLYIFLGFGILNTVCFIAAYVFSNRYVVMVSPFCLYFCSFVISNLIGNYVSPWEYLRFNDILKDDLMQIVIQLVIYFIILFIFLKNQIRKSKDML